MSTKNIVPRANNEGSIGTDAKRWAAGNFETLKVGGEDVTGGLSIPIVSNATAIITSDQEGTAFLGMDDSKNVFLGYGNASPSFGFIGFNSFDGQPFIRGVGSDGIGFSSTGFPIISKGFNSKYSFSYDDDSPMIIASNGYSFISFYNGAPWLSASGGFDNHALIFDNNSMPRLIASDANTFIGFDDSTEAPLMQINNLGKFTFDGNNPVLISSGGTQVFFIENDCGQLRSSTGATVRFVSGYPVLDGNNSYTAGISSQGNPGFMLNGGVLNGISSAGSAILVSSTGATLTFEGNDVILDTGTLAANWPTSDPHRIGAIFTESISGILGVTSGLYLRVSQG